MKLIAYCESCRKRHPIDLDPARPDDQIKDWYVLHAGHPGVGVCWPERSPKPSFVERLKRFWRYRWHPLRQRSATGHVVAEPAYPFAGDPGIPAPDAILSFLPNANVKVAYAASATPTLTLASLAASSTLLAGRESSSVDNTSNLYLDYLVAGNFKSAASNNQAGSVYLCVVGPRDDTPTWPDVFDGTDSTETVSKQGVFDQVCKIAASIAADNTASQVWNCGPVSLAALFGGVCPPLWVYFVAHNIQTSTNAWDATEGSHAVRHRGVYLTVS